MKAEKKPASQSKQMSNKHIIINSLLVGVLIGLLLFSLFRFITYRPNHTTHYHANWQVWINGQQQTFPEPAFYQEVASCSINDDTDPLHRAHMHNNVYDVIHVHANGVTYTQFLENIHSAALPGYLVIGNNTYQNTADNKVSYILNGKLLDSLNGIVIKPEDKLLINYGNEPEAELIARDKAIANKADDYNHKQDPASCSGDHATTVVDRINNIIF